MPVLCHSLENDFAYRSRLCSHFELMSGVDQRVCAFTRVHHVLGRCHSWGAPTRSSPAAAPAAAQPHAQAPLIAELSLQLAWADGLYITPGLVVARGNCANAATVAVHAEWLL